MPGHTVILSDTHLGGSRSPTPASLRPLWAGAGRLIVNGDVAELHHPAYRGAAARAVLELTELCEADGVRLTLLSGNHDAYLSDRRHLLLSGGGVLVMHGDALHPAIAPWSRAAGHMRAAHDRALGALERVQEADRDDDLASYLAVSQHAGHAEWDDPTRVVPTTLRTIALRPWKALAILRFWSTAARRADRFAARWTPAARFVILGHSHRAGVWRLDRRVIVNTGSFGMPGRPRAVVLDGRRLSVMAIRRRKATWRLVAQPLAEFDLPAPESSHRPTRRPADAGLEHPGPPAPAQQPAPPPPAPLPGVTVSA